MSVDGDGAVVVSHGGAAINNLSRRPAMRVARSVAVHPGFNYLLVGLINVVYCDGLTE